MPVSINLAVGVFSEMLRTLSINFPHDLPRMTQRFAVKRQPILLCSPSFRFIIDLHRRVIIIGHVVTRRVFARLPRGAFTAKCELLHRVGDVKTVGA